MALSNNSSKSCIKEVPCTKLYATELLPFLVPNSIKIATPAHLSLKTGSTIFNLPLFLIFLESSNLLTLPCKKDGICDLTQLINASCQVYSFNALSKKLVVVEFSSTSSKEDFLEGGFKTDSFTLGSLLFICDVY